MMSISNYKLFMSNIFQTLPNLKYKITPCCIFWKPTFVAFKNFRCKIKGTFDLRVNHHHHNITFLQLIDLATLYIGSRKDLGCILSFKLHHATTYPFYKTQKKVKTKRKGKDGQISLSICIVLHNILSFLSTSLLLVPFGRLKGQTWWIVQRKIPSRFVK